MVFRNMKILFHRQVSFLPILFLLTFVNFEIIYGQEPVAQTPQPATFETIKINPQPPANPYDPKGNPKQQLKQYERDKL